MDVDDEMLRGAKRSAPPEKQSLPSKKTKADPAKIVHDREAGLNPDRNPLHTVTSGPSTGPLNSDIPTRSLSVPASHRRVSAPISSTRRPSSLVPIAEPASSPLHSNRALSHDNTDLTLLYEDPRSRVTAYRTPGRRDDDDDIINRKVTNAQRRETVRVSLGDITIDIESSPLTPRAQVTPATDNPRLSLGFGGRRIARGEVPSTPGSSPVKFKSESLRDEEIPTVPARHEEESRDDVPDIITGEELARLR